MEVKNWNSIINMWYWAVIIAVLGAVIYGYTVSSKLQLSDKVGGGCSSCPSKKNEL